MIKLDLEANEIEHIIEVEEQRLSQLLEAKRLLEIVENFPEKPNAKFEKIFLNGDAAGQQKIVDDYLLEHFGLGSKKMEALVLDSLARKHSSSTCWEKLQMYLRTLKAKAETSANLSDLDDDSFEKKYSSAFLLAATPNDSNEHQNESEHNQLFTAMIHGDAHLLHPFQDPDLLFSERFGSPEVGQSQNKPSPCITFSHPSAIARSAELIPNCTSHQNTDFPSDSISGPTKAMISGEQDVTSGEQQAAEKPKKVTMKKIGETFVNGKKRHSGVEISDPKPSGENISIRGDHPKEGVAQRIAKKFSRLDVKAKDRVQESAEEPILIRSVDQRSPYFLRQHDIFEDGMPPTPRSGRSHFSVELSIEGGGTYKNSPCPGNVDHGCLLDQDVRIPIDEKILEAVSKATKERTDGPFVTATCFDCGLFEDTDIVGTVSFRVSDILGLPKGWNEFCCTLLDVDEKEVIGHDKQMTELCLAFCTEEGGIPDERRLPTLASILATAEGPLTLQKAGGMIRSAPRSEDCEDQQSEEDDDDDDDESSKKKIFYWKEWLEKFLDSLWVTVFILILLLLDITMFLASTIANDSFANDTGHGSTASEDIITYVVTGCSMIDLTLRQVTQGLRFWGDKLNLLYCLVIWLSVAVVFLKLIAVQSSSLSAADGTTGVLRVISRVALALRLLRIILQMRKARQLSGKVRSKLRVLISQNRRRYTKHGFDLDITYITDRVLAMSAPSFGTTSAYRNDIHVVARFLSYMHYGRFFVWNLCDTFDSSDGLIGQYHTSMIFHQVQRVPTEDHCAPLLVDLFRFCEEATKWLLQHPKNVVVAHCKGGKGRTGVFIAALLVWTGHRRTALDALELFTFRRTRNYDPELGLDSSLSHGMKVKKCNQTVEGPSQIRYGINPVKQHKMLLRSIRFIVGAAVNKHPWNISFTIKCLRAPIFDSKSGTGGTLKLGGGGGEIYEFATNVVVWGDVCIDFYKYKTASTSSKKSHCFFLTFNTAFYSEEEELHFTKFKLDKLCKDRKNKICDSNFQVDLNFTNKNEFTNDEHHLRHETRLIDLFQNYGEKEVMILILLGSVEGIVEEPVTEGGSAVDHPLGRCIPSLSDIDEERTCVLRYPTLCLLGPGSAFGTSPFLSSSALTLQYKARTDVTIYKIKKVSVRKSMKNKWAVLQNVVKSVTSLKERNRRKSRVSKEIGSPISIPSPQQEESTNESLRGCEIDGIVGQDLASFYRSLSTNLATRLTRVQSEGLRIANLKAFNDKQTVKISIDQDENAQLLKYCKDRFGLLMTERIIATVRCYYKGDKISSTKWSRMRLVILRNSLVLDPGFYGARVSIKSFLGVVPSYQAKGSEESSIMLNVLENVYSSALIKSKKELAKTEHEVKFINELDYKLVYASLSNLAKKGATIRLKERERLFDHPALSSLLDRVAVHNLKRGETLNATALDSLFIVERGEVKLVSKPSGGILRVVPEGCVFGEANFALQITPVTYEARASEKTTVFEISGQHVRDLVECDAMLCAQLFFVLCQILHNEIQAGLEDTFPGAWSRHHAIEPQLARRNSNIHATAHALTPQNSVRSE